MGTAASREQMRIEEVWMGKQACIVSFQIVIARLMREGKQKCTYLVGNGIPPERRRPQIGIIWTPTSGMEVPAACFCSSLARTPRKKGMAVASGRVLSCSLDGFH
jgi:hypothetical protein